jgi:hypothetical protein
MTQNSFVAEVQKIIKLLPRQLISPTVFFWTYPLSLLVAVLIAPAGLRSIEDFGKWLLLGFISHSVMYPFVSYGKSGKSLSMQIVLVLGMGVVRGGAIGILAPIFGLEDSLSVMARVLNSALAVFYWNQAGAIIVEHGVAFKTRVKEILNEILEKKIVGMPDAAKSSSNELIGLIGHLQEKIVETVGSSPTPEELKKASGDIDALINSHIRPLSQSRWRDGELTWLRAGFISVLKRTLSSQRIPVVGVILLTLPFTLVAQTTRIGFVSMVFVEVIWLSLVALMNSVNYRNIKPEEIFKANIRFLLFVIAVAYPITFAAQTLVSLSDSSTVTQSLQGYAISAISQLALFLVGTLLVALYDDQEFAFQFLRDVIEKGELESLLEKTRSGNADVNFAQYVHAEVQSQLLACKLLLLKAAESDFEIFSPDVTQQIIERMEKIKQPYQKPASRIPAQRIAELSQSWAGLAEITFDLSPQLNRLESYSDVTSQLIEEAVVNSIRHGGAKKIAISSRGSGHELEITVRDDGQLGGFGSSHPQSGLGTILFETFAQSWKLERVGEETLLTFTVNTSEKEKVG